MIGSTKPDDHRARLRLGEPAAHEVEELLLADLGDGRLVAEVDVVLLDVDVQVGIRARLLVEDQRVADDLRLRAGRALRDLEQAAVAAAPPFFEIDFDVITLEVFLATWTTLPPASWCWPLPAKAIESTSPCARSPISQIAGYFIVTFEPRFPSTHSIVASS